MVFSLFTANKHFGDRWIGHFGLNRMGVHPGRMRLAAACAASRRWLALKTAARAVPAQYRADFARDGYVKIENFLPASDFERLSKEVRRVVRETEAVTPLPQPSRRGFQKPVRHAWGFDRFDGGTLNRFIDIDAGSMPCSEQFTHDRRLQ